MKIEKKFTELKKERALFTVIGKMEARFYTLADGNINLTEEIKLSKPKYRDREGHFESKGRGIVIRRGSVMKKDEQYLKNQFYHLLEQKLRQIIAEISAESIYFFYPRQMSKFLEKKLPKDLGKKIKTRFYGNFLHQHPFRLLEKINSQKLSGKKTAAGTEANKLLKK
ncbi:hypothetical protein C4569_00030 [Candidatus Parcubacteria bacterium]|nr:MAG: hypothetical protein C4569_00030 [Candidatus Parcubacteria bacterium]